MDGKPELSIVVTLLNEEGTVEELYERTVAAVDGRPFELLFVDDGSSDATFERLRGLHRRDPRVRAIRFARNFGQHPAMHAGFTRARGDILVTMDGDLQNQPEDIPRLVAAVESGADVASGRRAVEPMLGSIGRQKFTKALVLSGGASVVEVDVAHAPRRDPSRYSPLRLTRVALHVLAGFWPQPIQWIGLLMGGVCTLAATALGIYGVVFWITESNFPGPLFGGTLIVFVLGIQGFILALVGEYLGRIQRQVEGSPLYTIAEEL
jgi:undecaprenyl-phosphate 4-deoxy-4-formamido-L-arabinose transferase